MNRPGVSQGNWAWRYTRDQLDPGAAERLLDLTRLYGRLPHPV
jgi:4-alpha-glucanotransferase